MSLGIILLIVVCIPLLDYLVKINIIRLLTLSTQLDTFIPFIKIVRVENFGVAFGILNNESLFVLVSTLIIIIVLIVITFFKKINDTKTLLGMSLIVGGGIGNLLDRFTLGYVVDYIKLIFFPPVFNLSDCFICLGVSIIIIKSLKVKN